MDISKELGLPPVTITRLRSEIDFYGISSVLASELSHKRPLRSPSTWRHGWHPFPPEYVTQIIWRDFDAPYHLVATEKHRLFLESKGVKNVVATGLPFIYADLTSVRRITNSLLVMPPHSLPYTKHKVSETEYVEYIKKISATRQIVFCIHPDCYEKGMWHPLLEREGIDWVVGASPSDSNSLWRMQRLFRMFEYMTTNDLGSHVVYALYCGCKVSVAGPTFERSKDDYFSDPHFQKNPELLEFNIKHSSLAVRKEKFPFLYVPLEEAKDLSGWAYEEVGASCRKSAEELKKYLGWDLRGQIKLRLYMLKRAVQNPTEVPRALLRRFAKKEVQ